MIKNYDLLINEHAYEVIVPEYYNRNIPKYFTQENRGDLPMLNGHRVSWEEFNEARPDIEREESFIPEMIYNPCEMNQTVSYESISGMIDLIDNDVPFDIYNPAENYPKIIEVIKGYLEQAQPYVETNQEIKRYVAKAETTLTIMTHCYEQYLNIKSYKLHGKPDQSIESDFDRIEKRFNKDIKA